MKLSRKQELALIDIGLRIHLDKTLIPEKAQPSKENKPSKFAHKWSAERRAKFMRTWKKKHKA